MLSSKIKDLIGSEKAQNESKYLSFDEKKRREVDAKRNDILLVLNHVKSEILRFEHGKEVKLCRNGVMIYVGSVKELQDKLSTLAIAEHMYSAKNNVDFFEFFEMKDKGVFRIQDELKELKEWVEANDLGKLILKVQHDGFGLHSWNEIWLKPKK